MDHHRKSLDIRKRNNPDGDNLASYDRIKKLFASQSEERNNDDKEVPCTTCHITESRPAKEEDKFYMEL